MSLTPAVEREWRLVDGAGAPVADARIRLAEREVDWEDALEAGATGAFRLAVARTGSTAVEVQTPALLAPVRLDLDPSRGPLLELPALVRVRGSVRSSDSEAVSDFRVVVRDGDTVLANRRAREPGAFELALFPAEALTVQIRKLGYADARSGLFPAAAGTYAFDAVLEPVPVLRGVVRDADGAPVDYGKIVVAERSRGPRLIDGTTLIGTNEPSAAYLGGDGGFELNRPDGPFALTVACRGGFAFVGPDDLAPDGGFRVEPWARIEGWASSARAGERLRLRFDRFAPERTGGLSVDLDFTATVDADGRFEFAAVPAGTVRIVDAGERELGVVELSAGEAAAVELGD